MSRRPMLDAVQQEKRALVTNVPNGKRWSESPVARLGYTRPKASMAKISQDESTSLCVTYTQPFDGWNNSVAEVTWLAEGMTLTITMEDDYSEYYPWFTIYYSIDGVSVDDSASAEAVRVGVTNTWHVPYVRGSTFGEVQGHVQLILLEYGGGPLTEVVVCPPLCIPEDPESTPSDPYYVSSTTTTATYSGYQWGIAGGFRISGYASAPTRIRVLTADVIDEGSLDPAPTFPSAWVDISAGPSAEWVGNYEGSMEIPSDAFNGWWGAGSTHYENIVLEWEDADAFTELCLWAYEVG